MKKLMCVLALVSFGCVSAGQSFSTPQEITSKEAYKKYLRADVITLHDIPVLACHFNIKGGIATAYYVMNDLKGPGNYSYVGNVQVAQIICKYMKEQQQAKTAH